MKKKIKWTRVIYFRMIFFGIIIVKTVAYQNQITWL